MAGGEKGSELREYNELLQEKEFSGPQKVFLILNLILKKTQALRKGQDARFPVQFCVFVQGRRRAPKFWRTFLILTK